MQSEPHANELEKPFPEGGMGKTEIFWKNYYNWLREAGYQLRPRYSPDWTPSWKTTGKFFLECEDGIPLEACLLSTLMNNAKVLTEATTQSGQIIDAIHTSSGSSVVIKRMYKSEHPLEEEIMRYLSTEPLSADPQNRCIKLIEVLRPPDDEDLQMLVMPLLRSFTSPPFDTFGEAIECFRQVFEGLHFMHKHRVAHRDVNFTNFMMDAKNMFPNGYHPQKHKYKPDLSGRANFLTRTQRPPGYFFVDFGLSRRYDIDNNNPLEDIIVGGDRTVPEFQKRLKQHNPFQTDVYCAGNMIRQMFMEGHPTITFICGYQGFSFMKPLINDMVQDDPTRRPTMEDVVKRFEIIVSGLSQWKLRSRPVPRQQNIFRVPKNTIQHWRRRISFVVAGNPAIPRS